MKICENGSDLMVANQPAKLEFEPTLSLARSSSSCFAVQWHSRWPRPARPADKIIPPASLWLMPTSTTRRTSAASRLIRSSCFFCSSTLRASHDCWSCTRMYGGTARSCRSSTCEMGDLCQIVRWEWGGAPALTLLGN